MRTTHILIDEEDDGIGLALIDDRDALYEAVNTALDDARTVTIGVIDYPDDWDDARLAEMADLAREARGGDTG